MIDLLFDSTGKIPNKIVSKLVNVPVDFNTIWQHQDKIRNLIKSTTDADIVNMSYDIENNTISIELNRSLEDEELELMSSNSDVHSEYDCEDSTYTKFIFYLSIPNNPFWI